MKIPDFAPFIGEHCETTATGNLLRHAGWKLSEPMLFGLGQGLGFILWSTKQMPFPFVGGRRKFDGITLKLEENLGFELDVRTTRSKKKAWKNVATFLEAGRPVALKLDCFHLPYFSPRVHFAGHYVAAYGFDGENAFVLDTRQQGGRQTVALKQLELARLEKGPMSSSAMSWTVAVKNEPKLKSAIRRAIQANAHEYLNPPISNFGHKGVRKLAKALPTWLERFPDAPEHLRQMSTLMERGGTGGALFRNFYRDFLVEAQEHVKSDRLRAAHLGVAESAKLWSAVAEAIDRGGRTESRDELEEASRVLVQIAAIEHEAITELSKI